MDDADPASQFFPGQDEVDLYAVLEVTDEASVDEIKKAYRKLALKYHPDKAGSSEDSVQKFQQIGFAYAVLSDEKRKKRYDDTGRTDESFFDGEADWNAYFKELWKGEVNQKTLDDFVKTYQGSDEERQDILSAYTASSGSLDALFENVMCSNVLTDEERFIEIVNSAIQSKDVKSFPQWKKDIKDTKKREKRKKDAEGEAKEAEELAKELGVHDKIFGDKDKKKAGKKGSSSEGKNVNEDGVDEDALRALIQSRNSKNNTMNNLIEKLEAKYGAASDDDAEEDDDEDASSGKGKKKQKRRRGRGKKADEEQEGDGDEGEAAQGKGKKRKQAAEPSEEEFQALQAKMFGDKAKKDSEGAKEQPAADKAKRSRKSKKA